MELRNHRRRIVLVCVIWMSSVFAWTQSQLFTERLKLDDRDPLEAALAASGDGKVMTVAAFQGSSEGSNDLVSFDFPFGLVRGETALRGGNGIVTRDIASGSIFALSKQIVEFAGRLFMSYVHNSQLRLITRPADGSAPWQPVLVTPEQVFFSSNLVLTKFGVIAGGFDATANDIKLYLSTDGSNFSFHRSIAPPAGVILGAARGGKRFAMAGGANSRTYCIVYGETFTGLTQMRVNCETFPALGFNGAPALSTGNTTFPLTTLRNTSDNPIIGLQDGAETGPPNIETDLLLLNNATTVTDTALLFLRL